MNTEIKSAEEILKKHLPLALHPYMDNGIKAMEEYAAQFTPAIVGDGIEEAAEKYAKQFYGKSMSEFSEFHRCKNNFIAGWKAAQEQPIKSVPDAISFSEWLYNERYISYEGLDVFPAKELYTIYLQQLKQK